MTDTIDSASYTIRPNLKYKFRPANVKEVIQKVLEEFLSDKQYSPEQVEGWTKEISDSVKSKVKDLGLDRYKLIVQTVIGEQRGEGVKMGCRCLWDMDTDNYAQDIFMNVSITS